MKESGIYHLKVVAIGEHIVYYVDDTLVLNPADYSVSGWNHGQDDAYLEGVLDLMSWNTNVTYQNVKYAEITDANSPELSKLNIIGSVKWISKSPLARGSMSTLPMFPMIPNLLSWITRKRAKVP